MVVVVVVVVVVVLLLLVVVGRVLYDPLHYVALHLSVRVAVRRVLPKAKARTRHEKYKA